MAKNGNTLPATIESFAVMQADLTDLRSIISENLGKGASLSPFDLDRITVPAGGATTWSVPSLDGDTDAKEVEGIIIAWKTGRAYWKAGLEESGGGSPPDCSSDDGEVGHGDPGGACDDCPLSKFGSDRRGRGQACKQFKLLFILRANDMLPIVVSVPPSSLKPVNRYFTRLASGGVAHWRVLTRLKLQKTKNSDGIGYAEIVPEMGGRLDDQEIQRIKVYREALTPAIDATPVATHVDPQDAAAA